MNRNLTICFTSDIHGYYSAVDYASGKKAPTGLANCMNSFPHDGNTLILDGGDNIEGSPFTYWFHNQCKSGDFVPARVMNIAGYDFVTIGNHDFNYGKAVLERYLCELDARCVSANVEGVEGVTKTAVVTLENGLRVGITGVVTHFVNVWEKKENLEGITVTNAFEAAALALEELKKENVDVTVCIYHGGFENDVNTGAVLSETGENQGYRICKELDFDVLLSGHQHQAKENLCIFGTHACQTPDKARQFARVDVTVAESGEVSAVSSIVPAGDETDERAAAYLAPLDREIDAFLDTPVGHLDVALEPKSPLEMAINGSYIANFFNQVQLEASGADISATCLGNEVKGFNKDVTIRDVVATYVYPNTLKTLRVNRAVLKAALERCAEYFAEDGEGNLCVSDAFLIPIVQHYNYDYYSGLEVTFDIRRPVGDRVISMLYRGEELQDGRELTVCVNNYRATGTGGYPLYARCEVVKDQPTEIAQMIIEYIDHHGDIIVDKTQWIHILH